MPIGDSVKLRACASARPLASRFQRTMFNLRIRCGDRSPSTMLIASLMLGVSSSAVLAAGEGEQKPTAEQATNEMLMKKLQAMERRMQLLESELKQKRSQDQAAAKQAPPSGRPAQGQPNAAYAQATPQPASPATPGGTASSNSTSSNKDLFGVGTSPIPGMKIGMYGEIKFGRQQNPAAGGQWQNGFDMARLVLLPTYQVTENIVFNAEIEFEHAGSGFDNDDKLHGTAEIEQAFFDVRFNDHFTFRSPGVDLVPISFNNLYHEPTLFYSVERPELANGLIPTTWAAASTGFYGKIVDGLNYQFQLSSSAEDYGDSFDRRGENGAVVAGGYAGGFNGIDALGLSRSPTPSRIRAGSAIRRRSFQASPAVRRSITRPTSPRVVRMATTAPCSARTAC